MTTAREQARNEATINAPSRHWAQRQEGANAASDVWEPLVLDMLKTIKMLATIDELDDEQGAFLDDVYARAAEALG
jgi:hypothetical protein